MLYNLFENRDFVSVFAVALLAEGVDRNFCKLLPEDFYCVALLAEGVDRNPTIFAGFAGLVRSPSSRRAWIEICKGAEDRRNPAWSPSSRRAWIEIVTNLNVSQLFAVALLAEGVDRNAFRGLLSRIIGVALLAEGVDRNWMLEHRIQKREKVALLAEGVDRNQIVCRARCFRGVALLAEGVDRNSQFCVFGILL